MGGLFLFYLCATFETRAWDVVYFAWSKIADCGILFWAVLYYYKVHRNRIRWLFYFSFLRLAGDIQSFVTGIGVNNDYTVAILFLALISITAYMSLKEDSAADLWLRKHLFKK